MIAILLVVLVALLVSGGDAFQPSFRSRGVSSLRMAMVEPESWPGKTAPVRNSTLYFLEMTTCF